LPGHFSGPNVFQVQIDATRKLRMNCGNVGAAFLAARQRRNLDFRMPQKDLDQFERRVTRRP
jgi:DNA-binding IclR family transcriptional regulator